MDNMRKMIFIYSMVMVLLFGCKPAKLSNPCDIKSKDYFFGTLIRFVTEDRSPSCYPSFDFQNLWGVFQGTSGTTSVNAMTSYNDQIIIGGNFQFVGPSTGEAVYLETATGKVLPNRYCPYLKVVGGTQTAISDGNGGFYIGGSFFWVQGEERYGLAHILPGCQLDRNFNVPKDTSREVRALLLMGDSLYVGGLFPTWSDSNQKFLVRLNRYTGAIDNSFNANVDPSASGVFDLETDGQALYVCGDFTSIGGGAQRGIAKLSFHSGSLFSSFSPIISAGTCLDLYYGTDANGSPNFFVGGDFTATYNYAFSIYPDGTLTTWNPGPNAQVNSIQQYQNTIYIGGQFSLVGASVSTGLASVNNGTGGIITANYNLNGNVASLGLLGDTLYLSGSFTTVKSVGRNYMAALSLPSESVNAFNPNPDGTITNPGSDFVSAENGVVFVTTSIRSTVNVLPRSNFAVLDEVTGAPIEGTPNFDFAIKALHRVGNRLFVGGSFNNVAGESRNRFAILDLPSYQVSPVNHILSGTPEIRTITSDESQLYVGGDSLTNVNGNTRNGAFALNLSDLSVSGWNPNLAGSGENFLVANDLVFLGGLYSGINGDGVTTSYQAVDKLTGTKRNIPSSTNFPNSGVYAQALVGSRIFLGGQFTTIGSIGTFNNIAVYNLTNQSYEQPNQVYGDGIVYHIAAYPDGNILIGGSFTGLNGATENYSFGVFNSNTNTVSPWKSGFNDVVYTSMYKNGKYYLGGAFTNALRRSNGGLVRSNFNE
ncbi:hypothetical protein ND857_12535 [Leptospira sp. 2 VSF16]|nr:hypothetical protein [Leptospira soteropolitanensis]MCW7493494.1 hypothetical protein [Leptospira soteropolitanensis]